MIRRTPWLPLAIALGVAAGCAPPKTAGQRGALAFGVDGSDLRSPEPLAASLAEGEAMELVVYTPERVEADGSHITTTEDGQRRLSGSNVRTIDVARARSLGPQTLEVVGIDGPRVTVRGMAAGVARLQVETWVGTDFIEVKVEPLGYVELDHPRWSAPGRGPSRTVLLAGGAVTFEVRRKSAGGSALLGYGVAEALAIEPPEAARVTPEPRALRHVRLELGEPGRVAIEPASGTAMAFDLVAATDVTSVELLPFGEDAPRHAEAGLGVLLVAEARIADGREVLGLGEVLEVESLTPEVCAVDREASAELAAVAWPRWSGFDGPFLVTTPAEGVCRLSARLGGREFEAEVPVEAPATKG